MKKATALLLAALLIASGVFAQVKTNFNNTEKLGGRGRFNRAYVTTPVFEVNVPNLTEALRRDRREDSFGSKIFYIAEPVPVDINIARLASWASDEQFAYGKFTLRARGAKSLSLNFRDFMLPKGTEIFIYNKDAEMITGPVTEAENNGGKIWGSSIYRGEELTIEIKVPATEKESLSLRITNVAYGYKDIFVDKTSGFGQSGPCNINVLCPQGNGWAAERNTVVLIANGNGSALCSGAMLMNTCATNLPYVLTADHCFQDNQDVASWRVHFQAWSATCTPSQNSDGILFNGSTFRANWNASDFCLVQLNQTPPANSGIHYAGWSRQTNAATSGVGIHHPSGDVMKISTYVTPLVREDNPARCNINPVGWLQWVVQWNQGVTEGGSSGSPLFDQNHRVVGQLSGGPSSCAQAANCRLDMYGRFDNSWTGGGTNATRLSNWLDPSNSGAFTTNTTNVSALSPPDNNMSITGDEIICSNSTYTYTLNNVPAGGSVTWSASPTGNVQFSCATCPQTDLTVTGNQSVTITATATGNCFNAAVSKTLIYGNIREYADVQHINPYNPCFQLNQLYTFYISNPQEGVHYKWGLESPSTGLVMDPNQTDNTYGYFSFTEYGSNRVVAIPYSVCSGDGEYDDYSVYVSPYGCNGYRVQSNIELFPNPARDQVTVKLKQLNAKQMTGQLKDIREVRIVDKLGSVKRTVKYPPNTNVVSLNIGNLPLDVYYVEITDGKSNARLPLSVIK